MNALRLVVNTNVDPRAAGALVPAIDLAAAAAAIAVWPGYAPTPVTALPFLARALGLGWLGVKREGERFDVGSFKALGPGYALMRAHARRPFAVAVAATSGNHGRAVAWGAARLGIAAKVFIGAHVSEGRAAAMRCFGAQIVRVAGDFDAAFAAAIEAARAPGHALIADVAGPAGTAIARDMLAGYAVLGAEIAALDPPPTHVFVGAGHGTLAAGICAGLAARGGAAIRVVAVEPAGADALRASLAAGAATGLAGAAASVMDGLVSAEVSVTAWPVLACGLAAAIAIDDGAALAALRDLARGAAGDPPIAIGETGIAGLAGVRAAAGDMQARRALGLGAGSRVLAVACEGVTDPAVFAMLTGT